MTVGRIDGGIFAGIAGSAFLAARHTGEDQTRP